MLHTATYLLGKNSSLYVILDGRTFSQRYQRERVFKFCSQLGAKWAMLECVCSEQTALRRLEQAAVEQIHPAMNRTPALYLQIRKTWEPIDGPKLMIDTEASLSSCAEPVSYTHLDVYKRQFRDKRKVTKLISLPRAMRISVKCRAVKAVSSRRPFGGTTAPVRMEHSRNFRPGTTGACTPTPTMSGLSGSKVPIYTKTKGARSASARVTSCEYQEDTNTGVEMCIRDR